MKPGRATDQALLRTIANKNSLNFATRRLLTDLKELENNKLPTVGVSARPMDDDLFVWHANIRGPKGSYYENGVFHLEIKIPETYPHSPPTVEFFTDIPHPQIQGKKVCLEMLNNETTDGEGWNSGYSILSVLMQLQSFFFHLPNHYYSSTEIKAAAEKANSFKCTRKFCKHGGKLSAWPPFDKREESNDSFKIVETETELFKKDLKCFHTKNSYEVNSLGIGLEVSKIARTGLIKQASPRLDYVSLKAFIKEGLRHSSNKEHFSYWLPLLFDSGKEKTLHLAKKAISMIFTNHTKHFKETMVLDIFPKLLVTLGAEIMKEKRHPSIVLFRIFFHIHYLYLTFLQEYPHLYEEINKTVKEFNTHEEKRHKDVVPNLGAFLTNFLVDWKGVEGSLDPIILEQLDRQVFWILKEIPELEGNMDDAYLDSKRTLICFKCQLTSNQMLLFWVMLAKFFRANFKSIPELLEFYKTNVGKLSNKQENEIQKKCFEILKIESYQTMYQYLEKQKLGEEELNKMLKQAVKNSKRKRYHGTDDEILPLPPKEEQVKAVKKDLPLLAHFIDMEKKELKPVTEEEWRNACTSRWAWLNEICENCNKIQPFEIANISDGNLRTKHERRPERVTALNEKYVQKDFFNSISTKDRYVQNFTWRDLFIKLDLEEHLLEIDCNPDFQNFYTKLQVACPYIHALMIPLIKLENLKSGYYYITALLSHLVNLKHLEIVGLDQTIELTLPALKALTKGFKNFSSKGGQLVDITYGKFTMSKAQGKEVSQHIFSPLKIMGELKKFTVQNNNMVANGSKVLSDIISSHKNLKEINMVNAELNDKKIKDIADGLIRANQIEVLNISNNPTISVDGLSSIIYNLSFSPKLVHLDISNTVLDYYSTKVVESLCKLLKISTSLEILNMSNCGSLNSELSEGFFIAVGEARALRKLNLSNSGELDMEACLWLGQAIAFNARRHGFLEVLSLEGDVLPGSKQLARLYSGMEVSDADYERWYGESSKVAKMSGKDFVRSFHNNLKVLKLGENVLRSNFRYNNWKRYGDEDPPLVKLIARSPQLTHLYLNDCYLTEKDADLLMLALDSSRANFCSKLKVLNLTRNFLGKEGTKAIASALETHKTLEVLDLSQNWLGVSGAKSLAQSLTKNTSLKYLNLFGNIIDVDGARAFEETLKVNSSLEFIDFGYNRLRNEGLNALSKGIAANKSSSLKYLGLTFNFIDEDGVISFLKKVCAEEVKTSLEELLLKNNSIDEAGLNDIQKIHQKNNMKVALDIFDKFKYIEDNLLARTIWIQPAVGTVEEVRELFERKHKCGTILSIRTRQGPKWPNRRVNPNQFYFVEFADPVSVVRALHVASRKEAILGGINVRVYKAGSGTYKYIKPATKSPEKSRTNVLAEIKAQKLARAKAGRGRPLFRSLMGVGRGRGRGRGRGIGRGRGADRGRGRGADRGRGIGGGKRRVFPKISPEELPLELEVPTSIPQRGGHHLRGRGGRGRGRGRGGFGPIDYPGMRRDPYETGYLLYRGYGGEEREDPLYGGVYARDDYDYGRGFDEREDGRYRDSRRDDYRRDWDRRGDRRDDRRDPRDLDRRDDPRVDRYNPRERNERSRGGGRDDYRNEDDRRRNYSGPRGMK